ncbi:MAG TPA: preprotein translocase subunit SecY [Clostridia bacterium]
MFETLKNAFKVKDIRKKIFITLFLLLIYRFGCWLPIPGVATDYYTDDSAGDTLLNLMSAISGGALRNGAFLALGVIPYINASIIMQLLGVAIPYLESLTKQGEEGRRKLNQYTRYLTLILALAQSIVIVIGWSRSGWIYEEIFGASANLNWLISAFVVIIMVGGVSFTMWLGEKITELNIGNGISLLIFIGILATAADSIRTTIINMIQGDEEAIWFLIAFLLMIVVIFTFIVFVDLSERRIPIQYAKQIKGRKMYGGQSTHIPIKVNALGVMPIIFASALVTLPQIFFQMFASESQAYGWYMRYLGVGTWPYAVISAILIFAFSFFYAKIQFNPEEISRNIQQYGGFIPGIRPGRPTTEYLAKINNRLTFVGAVFLAIIALVPSVIFAVVFKTEAQLINAFSATGMLIVVSVALEFEKQLQGQLMMKHYKGFLK